MDFLKINIIVLCMLFPVFAQASDAKKQPDGANYVALGENVSPTTPAARTSSPFYSPKRSAREREELQQERQTSCCCLGCIFFVAFCTDLGTGAGFTMRSNNSQKME